jgi:hypothetical protein
MKPKKATSPETLGELIDELVQLKEIKKREMEVLTELVVTARLLARTKNLAEAADIFPDLVKAVDAFEKSPVFKLIRVHHE